MNESVVLTRNCEAVQIPSGNKVVLSAGAQVRITQSLGGAFTLITEEGLMVRIKGEDADAIGLRGEATSHAAAPSTAPTDVHQIEKQVWEQLRTVFDPEIPVNVVELGLVYVCQVTPLPEGGNRVEVKMTLTAPGCGMGGVLKADAEGKILKIPGVKQANVEMVVDPPWNPSRMSEAAKLQLGML